MNLSKDLKKSIKEKLQECSCECDQEHTKNITLACEYCNKLFCEWCVEQGCILSHRQGYYCMDCERGMIFDTWGNLISEWGQCVDCVDTCEKCNAE